MFEGFETEEEYLDSLKKDDNYHFTIPFEYIKKNYGNDEVDMARAYMEVDVDWDEYEHGYSISWYCPEESTIDPSQGNADIDDFYENAVESEVLERLDSMGITSEARVSGIGRY